MKRQWVCRFGMVAIAGLAACSAGKHATATEKTDRTSWSTAALHTADELANRLRAAGIKCDDYDAQAIESYDANYRQNLPLAAAIASCTTHGDEDLTFEVFDDAAHAQNFVRTKQAFLCRQAAKTKLVGFPGFPYVDGGSWIVEPDEKETGDKIAPILGGQSKMAGCESAPTH